MPNVDTSGLYYKLMTIVNDKSKIVNKFEASLTDDAGVIIYIRHMFIVQATGGSMSPKYVLHLFKSGRSQNYQQLTQKALKFEKNICPNM
jgi:hypothetical protein